jgi:protein-serine/threonine kinase
MPHNSSTEKRQFSGLALNSNAKVNNTAGQKIKNFFRINSLSKENTATSGSETSSIEAKPQDGAATPRPQTNSNNNKSSLRNSRFMPHIGRSRSTTVASEGNPLDDGMSPTAHANPYFQHQGPPALRHHNEGSVPPSPPDTPDTSRKIDAASAGTDATALSGKEELARKLRRVASAPNAQGLFSKSKSGSTDSKDSSASRPGTSDLKQPPKLGAHSNGSALSMVDTIPLNSTDLLPIPGINGIPSPGKIRNSIAFRRTYSSNSIKVRTVEVGPSSFDKIKLIGKGDVGKVYLVREKKSSRLYAMKGEALENCRRWKAFG